VTLRWDKLITAEVAEGTEKKNNRREATLRWDKKITAEDAGGRDRLGATPVKTLRNSASLFPAVSRLSPTYLHIKCCIIDY
jgi:hypothetical protein